MTSRAKALGTSQVWITCEGATPHDAEYMGPLSYTPTTGVRGFYFPYLNQQLYLK